MKVRIEQFTKQTTKLSLFCQEHYFAIHYFSEIFKKYQSRTHHRKIIQKWINFVNLKISVLKFFIFFE